MKETLFKAIAHYNKEWVEGYYLVVGNVHYILPVGKALKDIVTVYPETVCEYTGLTDKNDVKIFDGDKLYIDRFYYKYHFVYWNPETFAWEVVKEGTKENEINHLLNCFSLGELPVELHYEERASYEVIGNIHDMEDK